MADGPLTDPLLAEAEELGYPFFDETILKELKQLDDAESGWAGEGAEHVEDEDVIRMRQLIREKPKDVIQVMYFLMRHCGVCIISAAAGQQQHVTGRQQMPHMHNSTRSFGH